MSVTEIEVEATILTELFGHVRRCDLKACRGVSKKWTIRTIPHMCATFDTTIGGSQSNRINRHIDDFVRLFRSNVLGIPFGEFILGAFSTTDKIGKEFLQLCGRIATKIDLRGKSEIYTVEYVSELLKSCPNLKVFLSPSRVISRSGDIVKLFPGSTPKFLYLKKIVFRINREDRLKCCPSFIEELIGTAPNLADIESDTLEGHGENKETSTISVVLNEIENLGKQSSIQSLDLRNGGIKHIEHLERMAKNGLKLKSLNFESEDMTDDEFERVQLQLTTICNNSLQHLKVEQTVDTILMECPKMPNLRSLCLHWFLNSDLKPVNLNENFPVLETLDIGLQYFRMEWNEFFYQFFPCATVKSLNVFRGDMRIHTFSNIQRAFPNLTKLELKFKEDGEEILRRIWTQLTQIESLGICGEVIRTDRLDLDSLFTGIPTKTLKRIHRAVNSLAKLTVHERRETILKLRNEHCRLPSVGNLTKLKHLWLNVTGIGGVNERKQGLRSFSGRTMTDRETYHLTDLSAYLALYPMNQLNQLKLNNCMFTNTCCEILTKETGLESWIFQNERFNDVVLPFVVHERD